MDIVQYLGNIINFFLQTPPIWLQNISFFMSLVVVPYTVYKTYKLSKSYGSKARDIHFFDQIKYMEEAFTINIKFAKKNDFNEDAKEKLYSLIIKCDSIVKSHTCNDKEIISFIKDFKKETKEVAPQTPDYDSLTNENAWKYYRAFMSLHQNLVFLHDRKSRTILGQ